MFKSGDLVRSKTGDPLKFYFVEKVISDYSFDLSYGCTEFLEGEDPNDYEYIYVEVEE